MITCLGCGLGVCWRSKRQCIRVVNLRSLGKRIAARCQHSYLPKMHARRPVEIWVECIRTTNLQARQRLKTIKDMLNGRFVSGGTEGNETNRKVNNILGSLRRACSVGKRRWLMQSVFARANRTCRVKTCYFQRTELEKKRSSIEVEE